MNGDFVGEKNVMTTFLTHERGKRARTWEIINGRSSSANALLVSLNVDESVGKVKAGREVREGARPFMQNRGPAKGGSIWGA